MHTRIPYHAFGGAVAVLRRGTCGARRGRPGQEGEYRAEPEQRRDEEDEQVAADSVVAGCCLCPLERVVDGGPVVGLPGWVVRVAQEWLVFDFGLHDWGDMGEEK